MLIKELEDMLVLVGELPRENQMQCARALLTHVEEWEERQQEANLSGAEWNALQEQRTRRLRLHEELRELEDVGINIEPRSGIVESYDRTKGYGYIQMEDGERALLHVTCLRANGFRHAHAGARIEFMAMRRPRGWQAFRVLSLGGE